MEPASTDAPWVAGELFSASDDASFAGFLAEAARVLDILASSDAWIRWWAESSKAPALEVTVYITHPPRGPMSTWAAGYAGSAPRVRRGRKRHYALANVDPDRFYGLDAAEQAHLALPIILDIVDRVVITLKLPPHPPAPSETVPAPLPDRTLRKHRLRQLRGQAPPTAPQRVGLTDQQIERERAAAETLARARAHCRLLRSGDTDPKSGR